MMFYLSLSSLFWCLWFAIPPTNFNSFCFCSSIIPNAAESDIGSNENKLSNPNITLNKPFPNPSSFNNASVRFLTSLQICSIYSS